MNAQPYAQLTDTQLLALCIWREARGESNDGKFGVGCVVSNRVKANHFYGASWQGVILRPYQFSSFNHNDPNSVKWPDDIDTSWIASIQEAQNVMANAPDITNGALYYFSRPLTEPPKAWGAVTHTVTIGSLSFWKPAPQAINTDASDN